MCNPQKSGASPVFITFFQVTQKILTKDIFHWLEVITEFLSFLQILSVRKNSDSLFKIFLKLCKKSTKQNYIPGIFWVFKSKLPIFLSATYIALFLPDTNNFLCMYKIIYSYLFLLFPHFVFCFHIPFLNLLANSLQCFI